MGLTNNRLGYAPDRTAATGEGYAGEQVPLMLGVLGFANTHEELVSEPLAVDTAQNG